MEYKSSFKTVFHGVIDIISLIDLDYNIVMVNKAYEVLLKKSSKECIGKKCYKIIRGRQTPCEDCPILNFVNRGGEAEKKLIINIENDNVSISRHPVYDDNGHVVGIFEIGRIITKEIKMEKELKHHERLKMMGELAASIVHEIKNPLVGIGLMAISILERLKQKGLKYEIYKDIRGIYREVKRLEKLLEDLIDFGKPTLFITEKQDIQYPIDQSLKLLRGKFRSNGIIIVKEFATKIPKVMIDVSKIQQVMLNILLNSLYAMPEGGKITITTGIVKEKNDNYVEKGWVEVVIEDTGIGIKEEYLPFVFDPFYTKSSRPSKRTGLGLAIVARLIDLHNGWVAIQSKEGKGTVVKIYLPIN